MTDGLLSMAATQPSSFLYDTPLAMAVVPNKPQLPVHPLTRAIATPLARDKALAAPQRQSLGRSLRRAGIYPISNLSLAKSCFN